MNNPIYTEENDNQTIALKVGAVITLSLSESPSTGYGWSPETLVANLVEEISSNHVKAAGGGAGGRVGGAGKRVIELKAKAAGTEKVAYKYLRSWEGDKSIARRFTLNLLIE